MTIGCTEVCAELVDRLTALGYTVGKDENHHVPILEALSDVKMTRPPQEPTCEICGRPDRVVHVELLRMLSADMCISCRRDLQAELERLGA